jgi:hypothetical protein
MYTTQKTKVQYSTHKVFGIVFKKFYNKSELMQKKKRKEKERKIYPCNVGTAFGTVRNHSKYIILYAT